MSIKQANIVGACIAIVIGVGFVSLSIPIYETETMGALGSGVFPFWVAVLVVLSGILYLRESLISKTSKELFTWKFEHRKLLLSNAVALLAYIGFMPFLGFSVSSFLFLWFHFRIIGGYRIVLSSLLALTLSILFSYSFRVWLYLPLPRGFLGW